LANENPNLNQTTVERLTSSLRNMQEANSAKQEPPKYTSIEDQLAQAKASRSQAESARQKIANEILEATKGVCQKLIADGEQTLQRAKKLEAEAQQKHREAQAELEKAQAARAEAQAFAEKVKSEAQKKAQERLDQAKTVRAETDAYRDRVMAEVQQQSQEQLDQAQNIRHEADTYRERVITEAKEQGQEILYLARSSAEQECNEMKVRLLWKPSGLWQRPS
jgi:F0F1-type ATP synthase membrane subunit b/b'